MVYIGELIFAMVHVWIADYQAQRFDAQKTISHFWWAFAVGVMVVGAWLLTDKNYLFALALVMERIWFFNPTLNLLRKKSFFYTNSSKNGSWIDAHIGNIYPYIFVISLSVFIFLQFFI